MNFIKNLFVKQKQQQKEPLFFDSFTEKIDHFESQVSIISDGITLTQYPKDIIQVIKSNIEQLKKQLQEAKVYILFLGTTSAGKSTFINSLLGQQILPSRNQECTQNVIFIEYNEKIIINEKQINSLDQAQQILFEMQKSNKSEIVNIQVPSLFHNQFPSDLRSRIVFIDTPGFKKDELQSLQAHFQKIDDKIGLQHRINVWVTNYTSFDNDKELQNQILSIYKPQASSEIIKKQNQKASYLKSVIIEEFQGYQKQQDLLISSHDIIESYESLESVRKFQSQTLFFILNKYDERKVSEDKNVDLIIQEISQMIGSELNIFKISALRAMRYRILNYGSQQAIDKFMESYFLDYRDVELFVTQNDCRKYCNEKIKNNPNLLQNQDYLKLQNQLESNIKLQISEAFYGDRFLQIIHWLIVLELVVSPQQIKLEEKQYEALKDLIYQFIDNQIQSYNHCISKFKNDTICQIKKDLDRYKSLLLSEEPQILIISACKQTLQTMIEYEQKIIQLNEDVKNGLILKLQSIFPQQQKDPLLKSIQLVGQRDVSILDGCTQLFELVNENNVNEIQKRSFQQYADSVQKTMGVRINPIQSQVGIISTGLSIAAYLGKRFAFQTLRCSPIFAAIGIGLMSFDLSFMFGKQWYSTNIINDQLHQWESTLIQLIEDQEKSYSQVNKQTFGCVRNVLSSLMQ
ncbi:unnamed protein product (macronuclear) [Paramecium tetraurelia]|uniref:Dynamin N-terminal domain-containing protein n=1 Tax=Paramecium tetraurelia TaxID=5888 RepID=A0C1Q9_PARTE|nr:uncharacterized protein GSPATT00034203001 [Paramecium tetraurelia]CAK64726.1 unnamed protein product [Paramecium tetraurelia]|eukprot:XP_001432123.1 hypothetical protein (macronuclear) [Paramecium tetraurelia strain d4-2]